MYWFVLVLWLLPIGFQATVRAKDGSELKSPSIISTDLNLRVMWGGPRPLNFAGIIEIDEGKLNCLQQLGIDANDAGFLVNDIEGKIPFNDFGTRFGGCDVRVQAKAASRIKISLRVTDPKTGHHVLKEYSWPVSDFRDASKVEVIEVGDCRLSVDRVPGDRIRVVTNRSHLIYNSDEPLGLQIRPIALPWNGTTAVLDTSIVRLEDGHVVSHLSRSIALDENASSDMHAVLFSAPKDEGVYELKLRIEPKRLLPGLILRHPTVERSIQFVVYNNSPDAPVVKNESLKKSQKSQGGWTTTARVPLSAFESESMTKSMVERIDPTTGFPLLEMAKSMTHLRRDFTGTKKTVGSGLSIHPGFASTAGLSNLVPGQLHRLTIETSNIDPKFRVKIIGSTSARDKDKPELVFGNQVFEVASQRVIHRSLRDDEQQELLELFFWPSTRSAKIEISNLMPSNGLEISKLEVGQWMEDQNEVLSMPGAINKEYATVLELTSANFRNAFGDMAQASNYDDWRLYLNYAESVAKYCKANGFEALSIPVDSEGSSLYPSAKLSGNARYDTGVFSADGRDPLRKDVVELMYRVMARRMVGFIPSFEFNSPLRELDDFRTRKDESDLLQHRAESTEEGVLYNPLSYRVQRALASVMDEFENRYSEHSNYSGFAIRIGKRSHILVSTSVENTNPTILNQFASSVGGNIPKDPQQREQFVMQHAKGMYQQWLGAVSSEFVDKGKLKPRWLSLTNENELNVNDHVVTRVVPLRLGGLGSSYSESKLSLFRQLDNVGPGPVHVVMDRPIEQMDGSVRRLLEMNSKIRTSSVRALPNREGTRSMSKVRGWILNESAAALLFINAGAVEETIHLTWDSLPSYVQIETTELESKDNSALISESQSEKEWVFSIPAGEAIQFEIEGQESSPSHARATPLYWHSADRNMFVLVDQALQLLEQGVNRLSVPQRRELPANGSFEVENGHQHKGRMDGWTTSLDPTASVSIDAAKAMHGRSAIKFQSTQTSSVAWLQSDPFALTDIDRLLLSFQAIAEQLPDQATVSLWVLDAKRERFERVSTRGFADRIATSKLPSNGNVISFDLSEDIASIFEKCDAALCRIQFEISGVCRVWLDDVNMSSDFLNENERRNIRSELFLAKTSLKNGDPGPAVSMLLSPRGRLVSWADNSQSKQRKFVSLEIDPANAKPMSTSEKIENGNSSTPSTEGKMRPIKRIRNYWSQRKDKD